jgi:hypothetical protein
VNFLPLCSRSHGGRLPASCYYVVLVVQACCPHKILIMYNVAKLCRAPYLVRVRLIGRKLSASHVN